MLACRNDVPQEYSGEDETISAVGLVRPKPGIFVPAIQYLLVVCTTIEVQHHQPGHRGRQLGTLEACPLY